MSAGHNINAQLRDVIERIENLESQKQEIADQIRDVYAGAKGQGFDTKILRKVIAMRKKSAEERANEEAMLETYMNALGMLADLPLGKAAIERDFG